MGLGTIFSRIGFSAPTMNAAGLLSWVFWVGLIVAAIWLIWPYLRCPLVIEYWEIRGGRAHRAKTDYGLPVDEDGVRKVRLFKNKKTINPIEPQYLFQISKNIFGLNRDKVYMVKDMSENFHPAQLELTDKGAFFRASHGDVQFFAQQLRKKKIEKYMLRGFWREHGPLMAIGAVTATCLIIVILTIKWSGNAVDMSNAAVGQVSAAINNLASVMKSSGGGSFSP